MKFLGINRTPESDGGVGPVVRSEQTSLSGSRRPHLSVAPSSIVFFFAVGLGYLLLSYRELFDLIADVDRHPGFIRPVTTMAISRTSLDFLSALSGDLSTTIGRLGASGYQVLVVRGVIFAIPVLLLVSALRSIWIGNRSPIALTLTGLLVGLAVIPAFSLVIGLFTLIVLLLSMIVAAIAAVLAWIGTWIGWLLLIVLLLAIVAGVVWIVRSLARSGNPILAFGFVGGIVVGLLGLALTGILANIWSFLASVAAWIGNIFATYIAPVLKFVVLIGQVAFIVCLLLGVAAASAGYIGRSISLTVGSAAQAAIERGKCIDVSIASGLLFSSMLCAAATNADFSAWFRTTWISTPYIGNLPDPGTIYGMLLYPQAEQVLAIGFKAYNPIVDATILIVIFALAIAGFIFNPASWEPDGNPRIFKPVMMAAGIQIALFIPLLLLAIASKYVDLEEFDV